MIISDRKSAVSWCLHWPAICEWQIPAWEKLAKWEYLMLPSPFLVRTFGSWLNLQQSSGTDLITLLWTLVNDMMFVAESGPFGCGIFRCCRSVFKVGSPACCLFDVLLWLSTSLLKLLDSVHWRFTAKRRILFWFNSLLDASRYYRKQLPWRWNLSVELLRLMTLSNMTPSKIASVLAMLVAKKIQCQMAILGKRS